MKKLLLFTLLCALMMPAKADITSVTQLYGKYKFTSTMTVTEAGKAYADKFAAESDVTITSHNVYDASLSGLAGGTGGAMGMNKFDATTKKFGTLNPNSPNHWTNSAIGITTIDGAYPWGGNYELYFTFDNDGNMTMDDFSLVLGNHQESSTTILATFTNCKLTLTEKESVILDDMSGNWEFSAAGYADSSSTFTTDFDMILTATDDTYSKYNAAITFDGYDEMSFSDVTFDGQNLIIPFQDAYVDATNKIALYSYISPSRTGNLILKKSSTTSMTLSSGLRFGQETTIEGKDTIVSVQYYIYGIASKKADSEPVDFVGTYTITAGSIIYNTSRNTDYTYPTTFDMEVAYDETNQLYLVTKFFGEDISNLGGLAAYVSSSDPNTLEISVGDNAFVKALETVDSKYPYLVLWDNIGTNTGKVSLTLNADGSATISDFTIQHLYWGEGSSTLDAFFTGNTITKAGNESSLPIDYSKSYTIKFDPSRIHVSNDSIISFPSEWTIDFTDYGEYGVYLKSFLGQDIATPNQGGLMIDVREDDIRTFDINLAAGYYAMAILKTVTAGEQYILIRDANGGTTDKLTITIDAAGNATVSDFTITLLDYSTNVETIIARYGDEPAQAIDYSKAYTVKFDASRIHVKDDSFVSFPSEWTIDFTDYGEYGVYLKSFLGQDIATPNQGGLMIDVREDDIRTFDINLAAGNYAMAILKTVTAGEQYILIRDANGGTTDKLTITIDAEGNATVSDFSITSLNYSTGEETTLAIYGDEPAQAIDYSKAYTVKFDASRIHVKDDSFVSFPSEWTIDFTDYGEYGVYLTSFLGQDIATPNQGGLMIDVREDDDYTFDINLAAGYYAMAILKTVTAGEQYILIRDANGGTTDKLTITIDAEGNATVSDFTITSLNYTTGEETTLAIYGDEPVVEEGIDYSKAYTVKFDASRIHVKDDSFVSFPSEWTIDFTDYGEYGVYLKSFLGQDIATPNQGGLMIDVREDDDYTFDINLAAGYYAMAILKTVTAGEQYILIRDANGGTTDKLTITIDAEGNATVSDFTITSLNYTTGEETTLAIYGDEKSSGIETVSAADKATVYVSDGVIYVGAEPTYVEVYNTVGVCVYTGKTTQITGLSRGIYLVKTGKTISRVIL